MDFQKVIAISGMPGLYEMINQRPNGIIVKSLQSQKTQFVSNRIHTFSPLDKISIYTATDSCLLAKVFRLMQAGEINQNQTIPSHKASSTVLKTYLRSVLPDYAEDRVYVSDIKKLVKWYQILKANDAIPTEEDVKNADLKEEEVVENPVAAENLEAEKE